MSCAPAQAGAYHFCFPQWHFPQRLFHLPEIGSRIRGNTGG